MGKTAKIVSSVLFVIIFGMLCWCIVQINDVKQGMLFLTQQTAEEVALAQDAAQQAAQTAQQAAELQLEAAQSATPLQGQSPQEKMDELQQAQQQAMQENAAPPATPSPSPEPTPTPTPEATTAPEPQGQVVYWVPNGGVWHVSQNCRTLANSQAVLSGTTEESGKPRACKVCG